MFLEGGTDSKEELQKLYDRRSITDNENIIIEATTIYEVDKTCMNQIKRCNCMHTSNIVWEMERMMEVYGCDVVLVDQIEL